MANISTYLKKSMFCCVPRLVVFSSACVGLILAANLAQAEDMAPLNIKLPNAAFVGTKVDIQVGANVDPIQTNMPPFMAPKDVTNLAAGKKVTCSDANAGADKLVKVTDGDKGYESDSIVLLRKGTQWVQVDLGANSEIFAVVVWHAHDAVKVYHDVIVQVSDTEDFSNNVKTLFNNDIDNSSKQGVGTDREYFETRFGKLVDAKGAKARFVRLYSKGSTDSSMNEITELEVYGRAAK